MILDSVFSNCITDLRRLLYCLHCCHFLMTTEQSIPTCMMVHFALVPNFSLLKDIIKALTLFLKGSHFKCIVLLQTSLKIISIQEKNYPQM